MCEIMVSDGLCLCETTSAKEKYLVVIHAGTFTRTLWVCLQIHVYVCYVRTRSMFMLLFHCRRMGRILAGNRLSIST